MKARSSAAKCPRSFEVEALRDGRLSGAEVTRFLAHARACQVCSGEMQALRQLAEALRTPEGPSDTNQLHVRRERTRLLAAFDASLVPAPRSRRSLVWGGAAALAALALFALLLRTRPPASVRAAGEAVKVAAASSAKWSRRAETERETITLEAGTLSIHVDHQLPRRRLLVILPDGELEDIGTTFSVTAEAGRTRRVFVEEGSVLLRLRDSPTLTLRAGMVFAPAPEHLPVATTLGPATPSAPVVSAHPLPSGVKLPARTPAVAAASAAEPAGGNEAAGPAVDFRAAMSALNSGASARAAGLFEAFLGTYPRDARAEDAAYLRVIALQRAGDVAGVRNAASQYLLRFPRGFRRAEVDALSH